jgi:hypothetical protein
MRYESSQDRISIGSGSGMRISIRSSTESVSDQEQISVRSGSDQVSESVRSVSDQYQIRMRSVSDQDEIRMRCQVRMCIRV